VGGLYALKKMQGPPVCASVVANNKYSRDKIPFDSGLIEMLWLSTGCWCLKRSAVEKMINSYPELTYTGDDNVSGKVIHGLYNPMLVDIDDNGTKIKKYLSEDWSFAQRWKALGGQIHADTSIVLRHIGKQAYSLWNVDVVSKPIETSGQPPPQMPQINFTKAPSSNPSLPPAGFNLKA
jgi:hypothetical protein